MNPIRAVTPPRAVNRPTAGAADRQRRLYRDTTHAMKHLPSFAATLCAVALAIGSAAGCKRESATSAAGGAGGGGPPDASATDRTVNVLVFSEYLPQDVLDDFRKETGVEAKVANIGSNEELLGKLRGGAADYDVISPTDYMVRRLAGLKMLRPLDRAKLPTFANLDPDMLGRPFDPQNAYSVPLFWGTTGIGYNKKKVPGTVDSWAVLFDPKHKGQVLMLDDPRELLAAALRADGRDPNTREPAAIAAATRALRRQHELVRMYESNQFAEKLLAGDVALAQGYNGQFAKAMLDKPDELAFVVPKEGATLWIDNLAIPAKARRADNAHTLIDYLNRPEVAARVANFAAYATPNRAARPQVKKELLENPTIYPPAEVLRRCATMEDLGESNKLVDQLMTEIKQ